MKKTRKAEGIRLRWDQDGNAWWTLPSGGLLVLDVPADNTTYYPGEPFTERAYDSLDGPAPSESQAKNARKHGF